MKIWFMISLVFFASEIFAASDHYGLENPQWRQRFEVLTQSLRCVVCQNQSLADSHATLADDLRNTIAIKIRQGESDEEIKSFLIQRYGDFILYQPKFSGATVFLWGAPFLFLIIGFLFIFRVARWSL